MRKDAHKVSRRPWSGGSWRGEKWGLKAAGMGADALRMDPGNEQAITEKKTDNFLT